MNALLVRELLELLALLAERLLQLGVLLAELLPSLGRLLANKLLHLVDGLLQRLDDLVLRVLAPLGRLGNVGVRLLDNLGRTLAVRVEEVLELLEALVDGDGAARNGRRVRLCDRLGEVERLLCRRRRHVDDLVLCGLGRSSYGARRVDGVLCARHRVVGVDTAERDTTAEKAREKVRRRSRSLRRLRTDLCQCRRK